MRMFITFLFALSAVSISADTLVIPYRAESQATVSSDGYNLNNQYISASVNNINGSQQIKDGSIPASKLSSTFQIDNSQIKDGTIKAIKLNDDVAGPGLTRSGSLGPLKVETGASSATGIEISTDTLRISSYIAGNGLTGGSGSPLEADLKSGGGLTLTDDASEQDGDHKLKIADDGVKAVNINADVAGDGIIPNGTTGALDLNYTAGKFRIVNDKLDIYPNGISTGDVDPIIYNGTNISALNFNSISMTWPSEANMDHLEQDRETIWLSTVSASSSVSSWQTVSLTGISPGLNYQDNYYLLVGCLALMNTGNGYLAVQVAPSMTDAQTNYYYQTFGAMDTAYNGIRVANGTAMVRVTASSPQLRFRYIASYTADVRFYAIARYNSVPYDR